MALSEDERKLREVEWAFNPLKEHIVICNSSRTQPIGCPGCICKKYWMTVDEGTFKRLDNLDAFNY